MDIANGTSACVRAHGLTPIIALWAQPTAQLVREFIALGGEATLVTVRTPPLDRSWLGLPLTEDTVRRMESIGVDPCGEFGGVPHDRDQLSALLFATVQL
jgi:diphthamide synthase (EF-2-diphthine--ammonia ligase)